MELKLTEATILPAFNKTYWLCWQYNLVLFLNQSKYWCTCKSSGWKVRTKCIKSRADLVQFPAKCASELSLQLHEIILILDSLQWVFWMLPPISQLFNVNYQPSTCQTQTIKMSTTKISPLQNEQWNLLSEAMKPPEVLGCLLRSVSRFKAMLQSAAFCFSWGWLSDFTVWVTPPILNKALL